MFRGRMDLLGWKDAPRASLAQWDDLVRFADGARRDGLTHAVVCGMGGSSLAPQVLAASFGRPGLSVLDSTDPAAVLAVAHAPDFARTLFVISSKSGSTVETLSFYRYQGLERAAGIGDRHESPRLRSIRGDHRSRQPARGPGARARLPRGVS